MSTEHPLPQADAPPLRLVLEVEVLVTALNSDASPEAYASGVAHRITSGCYAAIQAVAALGPNVRVHDGNVHGRITDESGDHELASW